MNCLLYFLDDSSSTITEKASEMTFKNNKSCDKRVTNTKNFDAEEDDEDDDEAVDMAAYMKGEFQLEDVSYFPIFNNMKDIFLISRYKIIKSSIYNVYNLCSV